MNVNDRVARIKQVIEGKIGQTVDVYVNGSDGEVKIQVSTWCNHKHHSCNHIIHSAEWLKGGYAVDYAAVSIGNLLTESLSREARGDVNPKQDKCSLCIFSPGYSPVCNNCRNHRNFIEA